MSKDDNQVLTSPYFEQFDCCEPGNDEQSDQNPTEIGHSKSMAAVVPKIPSHKRSKYFMNENGNEKVVPTSPVLSKKPKRDEKFDTDGLTPLELQFLKLKQQYPDVVLLVETGYLFRFFAEDALVAEKVLKFNVSTKRSLPTTSLPMQNLGLHVRSLVAKGYKVGVVRKTQTALMRSQLVEGKYHVAHRELSELYTKSTLIGEDIDLPLETTASQELKRFSNSNTYLMSVYEIPLSNKARIGIFAVCPLTGHLVYDYFVDEEDRQQLEARLLQMRPVEIVVPKMALSESTERALDAVFQCSLFENGIRFERLDDESFKLETARNFIIECLQEHSQSANSLSTVLDLPVPVICCLGATFAYLKAFKLDQLCQFLKNMQLYSPHSDHVLMDSSTCRSLELFRSRNGTDNYEWSLLYIVDKTKTVFGSRLLRFWLEKPLKVADEINERLQAVQELLINSSLFSMISNFLSGLPDLQNGITSIFYGRCSPRKYVNVISAFTKIRTCLNEFLQSEERVSSVLSPVLRRLLLNSASFLCEIENLIENLDVEAALNNDFASLFNDRAPFPTVSQIESEIVTTVEQLDHLRPSITELIGKEFQYSTFGEKEYVIVVDSASSSFIPYDWIVVARTSKSVICRTVQMDSYVKRLKLLQDQLIYENRKAWNRYMVDFKPHYFRLGNVVKSLAVLDCLLSFATLAKFHDLIRPEVLDSDMETYLKIENGYHLVATVCSRYHKPWVKNDTLLSSNEQFCHIITGPNMGGKSSYLYQVALIVVLAQIGSFVPASAVTLTPMDAIYVRSGVKDNIFSGKSAFFVEAGEVSDVLRYATNKSLVLLDEFGRCTSESDGTALAYGVLKHFITEVRCLCLVVTHFPIVANLGQIYEKQVANFHMTALMDSPSGDHSFSSAVTFLYQLSPGVCRRFHAIIVAEMAGLERHVLDRAIKKSKKAEEDELHLKESKEHFKSYFLP